MKDDTKIFFWEDFWLDDKSLSELVLNIYRLMGLKNSIISSVLVSPPFSLYLGTSIFVVTSWRKKLRG